MNDDNGQRQNKKKLAVVHWLLEEQAAREQNDRQRLNEAVEQGNLRVVQEIVQARVEMTTNDSSSNYDIIQAWKHPSSNQNGASMLYEASRLGHL